jgi:hypothetical protein
MRANLPLPPLEIEGDVAYYINICYYARMQPRIDQLGIILDSYTEVAMVNNGLDAMKSRLSPDLAADADRMMISVTAAAYMMAPLLPDLVQRGIATPNLEVILDRAQTEIAHMAVNTLAQVTPDDMVRLEAEEMAEAISANAQMSHLLINGE